MVTDGKDMKGRQGRARDLVSCAWRRGPLWGALLAIRAYQLLVSPLLPSCCRFHPSCSHYAAEALRRHGFFKGLHLGLVRLLRCHPFHPGGWDPVP